MMTELIIGREASSDAPRLAVTMNGKTDFLGNPGIVPKSISRKHCKITIGDDSLMTVENLTIQPGSMSVPNEVYVDGEDIVKKSGVPMDSIIVLGPKPQNNNEKTQYKFTVKTILKALGQNQVYPIGHLKKVYEDYQKEKFDLQVYIGKLNALSALPGVLSMTSIGLAVIIPALRIVMIVVAAIFALAFAIIRYKNASKIPLKTRDIEDRFRKKYICPNPACHHFLGNTPYQELAEHKECPYCHCRFTE